MTKKEAIAEGTAAFYFAVPKGFSYKAGQFVDLTLLSPADMSEADRTEQFSLAGSPREPELMIATRLRDTPFKRALAALPVGGEVILGGPSGSFTLRPESDRPIVALGGGIGITPIRAIVVDAMARRLPHDITVFYASRRPEDAPFMDELAALAARARAGTFRFIPTMTQMERSGRPWSGARGYINAALIEKYVDLRQNPLFYIAGPLRLTVAMMELLEAMGVPAQDILTEEFTGY